MVFFFYVFPKLFYTIKKLNYFTFYYAGDNLDSTIWEERSLSGLSNIDKKKEVMILALELAIKIN